jgi:membrane-associated phospholipid phosphatase
MIGPPLEIDLPSLAFYQSVIKNTGVLKNSLMQLSQMIPFFKTYPRRFPLTAAFIAVAILCALALGFVDYPLARFVAAKAGPGLLLSFGLITLFGSVGFWQLGSFLAAVILFLVAARQRFSKTSRRLRQLGFSSFYLFVSLISASLAVFGVKELAGRLRPSFIIHDIAPHPENFLAYHEALSFPSGHSANAFAAAVALGFVFPRHNRIFLVVAVLVGLSRVILNMHFASDVLMGGYIGAAAAVLVRRWFEKAGITVAWPQEGPSEK